MPGNPRRLSASFAWAASLAALVFAFPVSAQTVVATPSKWDAPVYGVIYAVPLIVFVVCLVSIGAVKSALSGSKWSLADALSEDVQLTARDAKGDLILDKDGKPLLVTEMRASTSRLIALMGMLVIMVMYLGFGVFVLYEFGATGNVPDSIPTVIKFLLSGMSLFAPYLVNKFMSVFQGISGK